MKAKKFVVLLILTIGVVLCANVGARQLEEVSKETKLGISIPKTATTNGLGNDLSVRITTDGSHFDYATTEATESPGGPNATGTGVTSGGTSGSVNANSTNADAVSGSSASGVAVGTATSDPNGASSTGFGNGGAGTFGQGRTSPEFSVPV